MEIILVILLIASVYALLFYRLMCRHFYEKEHGIKESALAAIFSLPPSKVLPVQAKKYHRRYWITLGIMLLIVVFLAQTRDFSHLSSQFKGSTKNQISK